ncbi:hypothetical protein Dsin_021665 [Dipteronia sinensis]|uniref:RNase H type-1 domain-containing protein n=1 Tax=Dipteronia sinensis TaxID=43782 RepID=A0AAE0DZ07_9ROSI|nr:hypothetical protein Dsin_021665 [Dipteronia sinensis]
MGLSCRLNQQMVQAISGPFTKDEVKTAILDMGLTKAPSPNAFDAVFFQNFWDVVGEEMESVCTIVLNDVLSSLITKSEQGDNGLGIRCRKGGRFFSHLFFVDDSILFCKASIPNVEEGIRRDLKSLFGLEDIQSHDKYLGWAEMRKEPLTKLREDSGGSLQRAEVHGFAIMVGVRFSPQQGLQGVINEKAVSQDSWCPPPVGSVKINTDVAVRQWLDFVGTEAVIRDAEGKVLVAHSKPLRDSFSVETWELLALREGLLLAKQHGFFECWVEVDAINVAVAVNDQKPANGVASFVIDDVKVLFADV